MNFYDYTDYRQFLSDYYAAKKAQNPRYSYAVFARQAGFKTRVAIQRIISGTRDLSKDAVFKVGQAMQLDAKAFAYFQHLVAYNHAKDPGEKAWFFRKLMEANPRSPAQKLREDAYEYFSRWYLSTVRELLPHVRLKDDFARLGKMLKPAISPAQAQKAVELLLRLGLVERTRTGYRQAHRALISGEEATGHALRDFHLQNLDVAKGAVDAVAPADRDYTTLVVSLPKGGLGILKKEIAAFRTRLANLADEMEKPAQVFHVNFQVFPTSEEYSEEGPAQ